MDFASILIPEFVVLAAFLYGLGAAMKAIPKVPDWCIPLTLLICGMLMGLCYGPFALSGQSWPYYLMMGGVAGWSAVGLNQTIKQIAKSDSDEDSEVE
ncbi:phage holin family protein [Christensenellaceae bacterium NSJ-44]|uniref:Phage holin family protein n=1 Tax=Luoshenia tenuis TaxID=2763654 RepID=A0A926D0S5_9FIRM|nr:phage holin family protein [Luoshenia tenuis]MBC8528225.1 phage holin family protein [Luoshenia tenuis]